MIGTPGQRVQGKQHEQMGEKEWVPAAYREKILLLGSLWWLMEDGKIAPGSGSPCFVSKVSSCACLVTIGAGRLLRFFPLQASIFPHEVHYFQSAFCKRDPSSSLPGVFHWGFQIIFAIFAWNEVLFAIPSLYKWQSHLNHDFFLLGPQRFHIWSISRLMLCWPILMGRFPPVVVILLLGVVMTFGQMAAVAE